MNRLTSVVLLCALLISVSGRAQEVAPLTEQAVVQETIDGNPTVRAAVLELRRTAEALRAEQGRYRPRLLLDATGTHQNTPNLGANGGTNQQLSQSLVLGAELAQTFSWGTTVGLRLENRDTRTQGPLFSGATDIVTLGPGYLLGARLSVTQPLLRGFGDEVGLAALRSAMLDRREQERVRDATASSTLSSALQAYWELWYAQRALGIEREAQALARRQRDETQRKVTAGSVAEVDLLTFETRLAELDQNVLDAEVTVETRQVDLAKALGTKATVRVDVSGAQPPGLRAVDVAETLGEAAEASYVVAELRLALERAETTLRSAADATRPRLDVSAWVQTQGLGNQSVGAAVDQLGRWVNLSGNVGLLFELPLSSQQHDGQLANARLAVTAARERLSAAERQVRADTEQELNALRQASEKITLAQRTAEVSGRSAKAQQQRLTNGAATPLEVSQAEDALRRARLSVERQRIDAVKAQIRLEHVTASLLARRGGL